MPTFHPLKWCEACAKEDARRCGRAYWHVDHQAPTTWVCLKHDRGLRWLEGRYRRWVLPGPALRQIAHPTVLPVTGASRVLAALGNSLRKMGSVDLNSLRAGSLERLRELGLLHNDRFGRHQRVVKWFRSTPVARALEEADCGLRVLSTGDSDRNTTCWKTLEPCNSLGRPLGRLRRRGSGPQRSSISECSSGRSRGVSDQFRLFADLPFANSAPESVWECMDHADSYKQAMVVLGATRHDIGRWLASDQALRERWKSRLKESRLVLARTRINRFVSANPQVRSSDVERALEADVRWLSHHAPAELATIRHGLAPRTARQKDLFGRRTCPPSNLVQTAPSQQTPG